MEQRDYLKKQIDELAQVLGKLLSELLQLKKEGKTKESLELTNQTLKTSLTQDLDELLAIPDESFISQLKAKKIKNEAMEKLADVLLVIADTEGPSERGKQVYKKCFLLFEKLESVDAIYSMDRHRKLERIKKLIGLIL